MIRYRLNGSVGYAAAAPDDVLPVRRVTRPAAAGRTRQLGQRTVYEFDRPMVWIRVREVV